VRKVTQSSSAAAAIQRHVETV